MYTQKNINLEKLYVQIIVQYDHIFSWLYNNNNMKKIKSHSNNSYNITTESDIWPIFSRVAWHGRGIFVEVKINDPKFPDKRHNWRRP